jgi:oxygen-dependent protoporphyrinogen oxidase
MAVQVAVVGSGAAGLAAAFRLQQAGYRVRLFEANDYLGGRIRTVERDGFLIDQGASVMPTGYRSLLGVVRAAGLEGELVEGGSTLAVAREGDIHYLDGRRLVRDAMRTRLVSPRSKLTLAKLALDVLRVRRHLDYEDLSRAAAFDTQSAGDYARARLNGEILEYLVDPSVGALVGPSSEDVSVVDLWFCLAKFIGAKFLAFGGGMRSYPELLGPRFDVELGARVLAVEEHGEEVIITWRNSDGVEHTESAAGCVVTVLTPTAVEILPGLDRWRADFLRRIRYTKQVNPSVALSRPPVGVPASYIEVPRVAHPGLLGIVMEHNKAPGRVPSGKGMITVYTESGWAEELLSEDDDAVTKKVVEAADSVLPGIADAVEFAVVSRWDRMGPISWPGYWREMGQFNEIRKSRDRLIQLAGDYFATPNLNTASTAGERAARELLAALTSSRAGLLVTGR